MKLQDWRDEIDSIDGEIMALLNRRARIVKKIGILKAQAGLPIVDASREEEILQRLIARNDGLLKDEHIAEVFAAILNGSRDLQNEAVTEISREKEAA